MFSLQAPSMASGHAKAASPRSVLGKPCCLQQGSEMQTPPGIAQLRTHTNEQECRNLLQKKLPADGCSPLKPSWVVNLFYPQHKVGNKNKKWCPASKEQMVLGSLRCKPVPLRADLTAAASPSSQSCHWVHPAATGKPLWSSAKNTLLKKKTSGQLASSVEYLNQMIAVKAHLGLISQLGIVVLSCGGQIVRGAGHMHQGVFFIAIILIGCLADKLLHRLIKFMNNNCFIKVYCTIMCIFPFNLFPLCSIYRISHNTSV